MFLELINDWDHTDLELKIGYDKWNSWLHHRQKRLNVLILENTFILTIFQTALLWMAYL